MKRKIKPVHPGRILHDEFMEPAGISQYRLAQAAGLSQVQVGNIIRGRRGITAETALRLERALGMMPGLTECAAFGLPHETLGEAIHVVVALNTNLDKPTEDARTELLAACRQHLPPYMVPTTLTTQTTTLPRNANGKIDRTTLRAQLTSALTACAEKPAAS